MNFNLQYLFQKFCRFFFAFKPKGILNVNFVGLVPPLEVCASMQIFCVNYYSYMEKLLNFTMRVWCTG